MAENHDQVPLATSSLPTGLLEELTRRDDHEIRAVEVARGRQVAVDRAFEDGAVVHEIASQLLLLSA
jgi:hypothetical protein